uniref:Membrane-associated tyrosine- and threonine-specific cdc2-inhibitory kinase n=1 Tax=Ascaris lumbricoides TaxID=6252 RepID=A0A9J2PKL5_ASCLU
MKSSTNDVFASPPVPIFYTDFDSPLSTKKERKRALTRSVPRVIRTAPVGSRFYPRRFSLQKPHFITFKSNSDPVLTKSKSYNERSGLTYFEQCFEQERKIGEGSFGEVFRVKSKDDNKWYAVKRTIEPFRNSSDRELKLREVQKHELLPKHPNLVEFIRAWEERGRLYIQTELCEYSLSDYAEREHNIPEEQLWYYFSDLVAAVNHLHSHDLLHLDIKPENIFISRDQICKLGDFGLIFDLNKDTPVTAQEGDSKYLAPEVLNSPPGKPADIFSLGISILELATDLDLPSRGDGWRMLREGNIPEIFTNKISPKLRHLIYWMMEPDPEKRPTAQQLLNDVTIQHYLTLRIKQRSGVVTQYMMEKLMWLYMCILYALQFVLWPVTKPLSYFKGVPVTPRGRSDSPRTAAFYKSLTPESPSRHILTHGNNIVQRLRFDNCDSDDDEHEIYESAGGRCDSYATEQDGGNTVRPQRRLFDMPDANSTTSSSVSSPISSRRVAGGSMESEKRMRLSESPLRSPAYRIIGTSVDPEANHSDDGDEVDDDGRLHKRSTQFTKRNLRAAMSAPVPRQIRAQLRTLAMRPLPKLDFTILDSPKRTDERTKAKKNGSARKSPLAVRQVDSRGSSADEMAL